MSLYSFIPSMSNEVKWHEVWSTLDNHNANIFIEELLLPKDNLQQSMKVESLFPGRSDASRHIRNIVGSDTASSVAYYLASRDANLSKLVLTKAKRIEKYKKSFLWLQRLLRPCLIFVSCVPIHFLFQARGRTVWQTVHVFLYYEGLWSVLEAAYINLGQFVPLSSIPLELLYILGLIFFLVVLRFFHGYLIFRYTHGVRFWKVLLGAIILLVILFVGLWAVHSIVIAALDSTSLSAK
jgi:hypothetical protein